MIYFTSDLHLGHRNIIDFTKRPFNTVEEMDAAIINNWNSVINDNDIVYILGDVSFLPILQTDELIRKLNGKKILIKGNHDRNWDPRLFDEICDYKEISYKGYHFVLMHYPIGEWNGYFKGWFHLHGHQHNAKLYNEINEYYGKLIYDVGVDANNFTPVSIEYIIDYFKKGENK